MHLLSLLFACSAPSGDPVDSAAPDADIPWTGTHAPLDEVSPGGRPWRRGIVHLHSPYSHDACDGAGIVDGVLDEDCLADLRAGLCATAMDFAMITDHPAYAAYAEYADTLLSREGDEVVDGVANRITCPDGHTVLTMPGYEDELMPIGLDGPVAETADERDRLLNGTEQETFTADIAAGGTVLQAHTEGQTIETLLARQEMGLTGVELFNLHAMLDPDIREADLGLDGYGGIEALGPFIGGSTDAEPDFAFLAFFQEQGVSLEKWDALAARWPTVATAGTDAHENSLPTLFPDGERGDSYRRMMIWFSNIVLADGDGPADYQEAIAAGRLFVAFEILGTPSGFSVSYGDDEMGGTAIVGDYLVVTCPTLASNSPRMGEDPEITVTVFKDGEAWQEGCGTFPVTEPGVYRVRANIVPHHLAGFLDDQAETLIHDYPWLYSNSFRINY